jgi:hypothetical protein
VPSHAGVLAFSVPVLPLSTIASTIHDCAPRLKVRMAPERQDKDKYTHAEVRFEHPARGKNTCDECAHFIRGSLGGWHLGGCELVKDPIEPQDWCNKFNASLVKPLKLVSCMFWSRRGRSVSRLNQAVRLYGVNHGSI